MKSLVAAALVALVMSVAALPAEAALPPQTKETSATRAPMLTYYSLEVTPELFYGVPTLKPASERSCSMPLEYMNGLVQWLSFNLSSWLMSWQVTSTHQPRFSSAEPPPKRLCIFVE